MKLTVSPISSNLFTYSPHTKTFTAEKSELTFHKIFQPFYDDSVDCGFVMKSSKTGREVRFYYVNDLRELEEFDGEIQGWKFTSEVLDNGEHYVCLIYND